VKFCAELTRSQRQRGQLPTGWEYRLPTEAQWEHACRAGTQDRFSFGDGYSQLADFAWYDKNAALAQEAYAHRVGGKGANPWGLFDLHGNVWEWCEDWFAQQLPGGTDPAVTEKGTIRVYRGGSWLDSATGCRSGARYANEPDFRFNDLGFRVALIKVAPLPAKE
jgi:sulfatase modifying factor 1